MTVIAYDGQYVAADKQATKTSGAMARTTKLFTHGRQVLAFSGDPGHGMALVAWFKGGAKAADYPKERDESLNAHLFVFEHGRPVQVFESHPMPFLIESPQYAAGSGRTYALAAMHLGYDARAAVEVASELDAYCGLGVDMIDLRGLGDANGGHAASAGPDGPGDALAK